MLGLAGVWGPDPKRGRWTWSGMSTAATASTNVRLSAANSAEHASADDNGRAPVLAWATR